MMKESMVCCEAISKMRQNVSGHHPMQILFEQSPFCFRRPQDKSGLEGPFSGAYAFFKAFLRDSYPFC